MRNIFYSFAVCVLLAIGATFLGITKASLPAEQRITLQESVILTADEQALIRSLPTLKVSAYRRAPPLSLYNKRKNQYEGISIDVFRFIADQINLPYEFIQTEHTSFNENMQQFEQGLVDVLIPASYLAEREQMGVFTDEYHHGFYSAIALREEQIRISSAEQLQQYRVGVVTATAVEFYLQSLMPKEQIFSYDSGAIYEALRRKKIDIAVFNHGVFAYDRIHFELFDMQNIYTLYEYPRGYSFLFKRSPEHLKLVSIFNRYIKAIDSRASVLLHEDGERLLIDKYIKQKNKQHLLWIVLVASGIFLFVLLNGYRSRQRMVVQLGESHARIVQQHQALQEANDKLERLSQTDALTGLANRRFFDQQFSLEHARYMRGAGALSILMVDIDYFKSINDHYGHAVGDGYLQKIAAVLLSEMSRPNDLAARYGGEEFVCILPETDLPGALMVAEQIREAVMALHLANTEDPPQPLTVSVGVATLEGTHSSADVLLKQADVQLYRAKQMGRNRVCGVVLSEQTVQATDDLREKSLH